MVPVVPSTAAVEEPPTKRRVGRPPRADRQTGVVMAEDTIMPSPESLS